MRWRGEIALNLGIFTGGQPIPAHQPTSPTHKQLVAALKLNSYTTLLLRHLHVKPNGDPVMDDGLLVTGDVTDQGLRNFRAAVSACCAFGALS